MPGFSEVTRRNQALQRLEQTRRESGLALEEIQAQAIRTELDRALIDEGLSPAARFVALKKFDLRRAFGTDPITSLDFALPTGTGKLEPGSKDVIGARRRLLADILRETVPEANISADDFLPRTDEVVGRFLDRLAGETGRQIRDSLNNIGDQRPINVTVNQAGTVYNATDPFETSPELVDLNQ